MYELMLIFGLVIYAFFIILVILSCFEIAKKFYNLLKKWITKF